MTQTDDCATPQPTYPELNRFGLTDYHKQRLCYPYTERPAFTFWEPPAEGQTLREWQENRCALCGFRDTVVLDHCHDTGMVRGWLCRSCNTTEGLSDHNLGQWRSGVTPAALMGIEEVYVSPVTGRTPLRATPADLDSELDRIAEMLI